MIVLNNHAENIIKANIRRAGRDIEFKRPVLNKFKENTGKFEIFETQRCIYHLASDYGNDDVRQSDAGKTHGYKIEMLLTEYNANIKENDYCNVGDKFYRIYSIINYDQENKFIDISLEEVRCDEPDKGFGKNV